MFVPMPIISKPINLTNDITVYNDTVVKLNKKGSNIAVSKFNNVDKYYYTSDVEWICKNNPDVEIYDIVYSHKDKELVFYSNKSLDIDSFNKYKKEGKTTVYALLGTTSEHFADYCQKAISGSTVKEENEISLYDLSEFLKEQYKRYINNIKFYQNKINIGYSEIDDDFSCTNIDIERDTMMTDRIIVEVRGIRGRWSSYTHPKLKIIVKLDENKKISDAVIKEAEDFIFMNPKDAFAVVNKYLEELINSFLAMELFSCNYKTICIAPDVFVEVCLNKYFHVKLMSSNTVFTTEACIEYTDEGTFKMEAVSRKVLMAVNNGEKRIFQNTYVNPNAFYKNINFWDYYNINPVEKTKKEIKKTFLQKLFG